jgi:hypothetical protein
MARCVNENCSNDPMNSPNKVFWGCDGDMCCNQHCYDQACEQMDHFCSNVLTNDSSFASWLGVPEEWVKTEKIEKE